VKPCTGALAGDSTARLDLAWINGFDGLKPMAKSSIAGWPSIT